ncbi:glycoside hydrolase family 43 protein [Glonium stellatum]|uniref:Glycoside hydrolase family 43 protein n=1 Tax=Glonium stellatum TaxID=574774 RepID=A0A8E2EQB7_9PEZI|nr:glycoside hydrolase family 43 protein [Glonium stellatum]
MIFTTLIFLIFWFSVPECLGNSLPNGGNSSFYNPILPGFHPDPSCIFVKEWDNTFFCASSSFNAFPGIPIHASKDLQNWKLIGNVLNRPEQLPELAVSNGSTSGIWAPSIRYHDGIFYLVTTFVQDKRAADDASRWDNIIFQAKNPFEPSSWSNAIHFNFTGYDTSPYWDEDETAYVVGSHAYHVSAGIHLNTVNLETGDLGSDWIDIWNGTGGLAPEGPHIYKKDGYYYLMIAEGGTGLNHMVTIARSKNIYGPYGSNPANPIVTNANTSAYFQTVGHADLFQDASSNWWGVALSTRSGPDYLTYPMGRETVLAPVTWETGKWPIWSNVSGQMSGWPLPPTDTGIGGSGPFITAPDDLDFAPGTEIPAHLLYWRFPVGDSYTVSSPGHPNTLRLKPSKLNLTAYDGNYGGPGGQTFIGRRQTDSLFSYSVNMDFLPQVEEEEAGISVFLTQNHHIDLGVVMLPSPNATMTSNLIPYFRFRAISSIPVPDPIVAPVPSNWTNRVLTMEIKAFNLTHYSFSAGPADAQSQMQTIAYAPGALVSWGFTGTLLGIYATSNGGNGTTDAYFSSWKYTGQGQIRN